MTNTLDSLEVTEGGQLTIAVPGEQLSLTPRPDPDVELDPATAATREHIAELAAIGRGQRG